MRGGLPLETTWSTEPYLQFAPVLFERLRREFGSEIQLLHDVHHRLRPIEAARLGKSLEPYHLFWMEDPVPAELQEGFRTIRQHTTTPIAVGEVFDTYVYSVGISQGQYSFSTAVGLFKSVIGLFLVVMANYLAKKFGEEGIY